MSLILDALNRSRQDKDSVPSLATHHAVEKVASDKRQYLPWVVLLVALVIIGWLMMARLFNPASDIEIAASAKPVMQATTNADASDFSADKEEAVVEEPLVEFVVDSQAPVTAGLAANSAEPRIASAVVATETKTPISPPVVEDSAVAQLYQNQNLADDAGVRNQTSSAALDLYAESRVEEPIDIAQVLKSAREEMKDANLDQHSVPLLATMSQQTKDNIPTLYYQRHDYSTNVAISAVVLNGEALKVGGSPAQGMKIEEILPDSVVLSYQGTQFRLRALNSWINL